MFNKFNMINCIIVLFVLMSNMPSAVEGQWGLAEACKWTKGWSGWGCDDNFSRGLWRRIQGVSDCNGFCRNRGRNGGHCVANGNYDTSTWCPMGQTCVCY